MPYAIFALIVVFGAEIRHALARLGRRLSAARGGVFSGADSYEDIVLAANHFSQTLTGALIVIEREIGLRTFIESGVPLDANLSFDLLVTIFRPSAPLHDGAVIVQKGRIAAAACFLPLSMNPRALHAVWHSPSRGHRDHGRDRRRLGGGVGRDGFHQHRGGRDKSSATLLSSICASD